MKKWLAGFRDSWLVGFELWLLVGTRVDSKASGEKQTITVATDSDTAPFTFKKG